MTTLTFNILYHRTLKNKSSDRILTEIQDILKDKRFSSETRFSYENIREGIIIQLEFINPEQMDLYKDILIEKDFFLSNTLMSKY